MSERPEDGRLNWMTSESQRQALESVDGSKSFDLAVDYFLGMPCWTEAGDPKYEIWMTHTPQGTINDDLSGAGAEANRHYSYAGSALTMYSHTGTHICSLNHIGRDGRFWNGSTVERDLGSRAWKTGGCYPPIISHGVLLDVPRLRGLEQLGESYEITATDLEESARAQEVRLERGDTVLVRTGRMRSWPDPEAFLQRPPGLGLDAAEWLCESAEAMCIGLDGGGEVLPSTQPDTFLPVHAYLLSVAGVPVIENLWLEDLAAAAVWEFAFLGFPLKLAGSTGMPLRPVALGLRDSAGLGD